MTTPLPPPTYQEYVKNSVSKSGESVKIVIRPALYTADQMQAARADLEAENRRLREALRIAHDHIDMNALRVSHCKDAATITAALESKP